MSDGEWGSLKQDGQFSGLIGQIGEQHIFYSTTYLLNVVFILIFSSCWRGGLDYVYGDAVLRQVGEKALYMCIIS